jgi:hypothetical protein
LKTLLLLGGLVLSQVICLGGDKPLENKERLQTAGYGRELAPDGEDLRLTLGEIRQDVGHVAGIFVWHGKTKELCRSWRFKDV